MAIIYTYPTKATPVDADLILISDSADSNKTKQITVASIKDTLDVVDSVIAGSGIGVSSATGAVTITNTGVTSLSSANDAIATSSSTGAVTITSRAYSGGVNIGHVPTGGGSTTFLRGDGTWVTPTDTKLTFDGTTVGGVLSYKNANEITTSSSVSIGNSQINIGDGALQFASNELKIGDIIGNSASVSFYTDGSEVLKIDDQGAFTVNGSTGTSGQYLKSNGSGAAPTWSNVVGSFLEPSNTTTPSLKISGANATDANSGGSGQGFTNTQGVLNLQGLSNTANSTVMAISGEDNVSQSVGNLINCFMGSHLGPGYALVGRIQADRNTNTLSLNSTSDYRLKENVSPMSGSLAKIKALNPVNYNIIDIYPNPNPVVAEGFLAHELQEQIPNAVTGTKDAVNEDGSINAQTVDLVKIIPHLVSAIKELTEKVEALES
tara:strand:+ start:247 stop:1554 length:1308 start_codon:yes stop_codon:yes gene_type:complete